jgi:hypothetical protein
MPSQGAANFALRIPFYPKANRIRACKEQFRDCSTRKSVRMQNYGNRIFLLRISRCFYTLPTATFALEALQTVYESIFNEFNPAASNANNLWFFIVPQRLSLKTPQIILSYV